MDGSVSNFEAQSTGQEFIGNALSVTSAKIDPIVGWSIIQQRFHAAEVRERMFPTVNRQRRDAVRNMMKQNMGKMMPVPVVQL